MLSTQDFAREVWLSLENIRERLAALETEARHTRWQLQRLEERVGIGGSPPPGPAAGPLPGPGPSPGHHGGPAPGDRPDPSRNDREPAGAVIHIRISRKTLGSLSGGGAIGGGLLAAAMALGRLLGWW